MEHAGSEGLLLGFWISVLEYASQDHVTFPLGPLTLACGSVQFQREESLKVVFFHPETP